MTALRGGPVDGSLDLHPLGDVRSRSAMFKPAFAAGADRRLISAQARQAVCRPSSRGTQPTTLFQGFRSSFRPRRLLNY